MRELRRKYEAMRAIGCDRFVSLFAAVVSTAFQRADEIRILNVTIEVLP